MTRYGLWSCLGIGLWLLGCQSPIKSDYTYDRQARFAEYSTFAWVTEEPLLKPAVGATTSDPRLTPVLEGDLRRSIERAIAAKGYQQIDDPAAADLVLSFSIGTRERVDIDSYPATAGYGYGRGAWYSTVDVDIYTEGILAIDFFDRQTRHAVWHGWGSRRLPSRPDPAKRQGIIDTTVEAILEAFPFRNTRR